MWNRNPPTNRNVPEWMWRDAVRDHEQYKSLHAMLCGLGLSPADADAYLDASLNLGRAVEQLDSTEQDFSVSDHTQHFADAAGSLATMRRLLGYGPQVKLERATHEPWGFDGLEEEVLETAFEVSLPMHVALTVDRKTMVLVDSVDYYQVKRLDKASAKRLAQVFADLAEAMVSP